MLKAVSILVTAIVLLAGAVVAAAQQDAKPVTIGVLSGQSREWRYASFGAFRQGLRELGWEEGKNLAIEERFAGGDAVTGFINMVLGLTQKRLAILKETLPTAC